MQRCVQALDQADTHADQPYYEYNSRMQAEGRRLAATLPTLLSASKDDLAATLRTLADPYAQLVGACRGLAQTADNEEGRAMALDSTRQLGGALLALAASCKALQANPDDFETRQLVAGQSQGVSASLGQLFTALQGGAKGSRACESAVLALEGTVGDLTTAAVFASAGSMAREAQGDSFGAHKEALDAQARDLVEATKHLVTCAGGTQVGRG